jgi:uncharacterized membrane protein
MSDFFAIDFWTLVAILGMGLATYSTRLAGLLLMRGVVVQGRLKASIDAVPPAVLMAVITPTVLLSGLPESLAAIAAAISAYLRLPLLVTIGIGMASVVVLRTALN